ncbi:MAG: MoxR family ATPase [Acidobacteria bacterium]|nr:MoxR family ATPase [Acidobacteriota bacterium]
MRDWITTESESGTAAPEGVVDVGSKIAELRTAVETVIRGKSNIVRLSLVALFGRGHLLIEDVPGIGKTTLANAIARSLDLSIQRIQFTSDLLPSDVIGLSIYNQGSGEFEWKPGPIFSNIVLADEINRATPKTQSALLEAMAEEQVTVDGISRRLPLPFMVIATQNPTEHHGTYPLPESQLDRFALRLHLGYPSLQDERVILKDRENVNPLDLIQSVMTLNEIIAAQESVAAVRVDDDLVEYLLKIVEATRKHDAIELGVSPRGSLALFRSAQALAFIEGRDYCIVDDIKQLVVPCFAHRLMIGSRTAGIRQKTKEAENLLTEILHGIPVPL